MKKNKRLQLFDLIFVASFVIGLTKSLPITSKALENNPEQLIWQTSWYSQEQGEDIGSPFDTKDLRKTKKITAKSIFIIPSFNVKGCEEGFKLDENGKCIEFLSINQNDLLVTRWQNMNLSSQHGLTTDESTDTGLDYDYISNEDENKPSKQPTQFVLPLLPIVDKHDLLDQSSQSLSTADLHNESDFKVETSIREENNKNIPIDLVQNVNLIDKLPLENKINLLNLNSNSDGTDKPREMTESESESIIESVSNSINQDQENSETVTDPTTTLEYTSLSPEDNTFEIQIYSDKANEEESGHIQIEPTTNFPLENVTTTIYSSENLMEQSQAEDSISDIKNPITDQFVDYFDTMLLNDSLLLTDNSSSYYFNTTDTDLDEFTTADVDQDVETTTLNFNMPVTINLPEKNTDLVKQFNSSSIVTLGREKENIDTMQSNMISDNSDEDPYKSVTENVDIVKSSLSPPPLMKVDAPLSKITHSLLSLVRFPTDDDFENREQTIKNVFHFKKIKFPDEPLPNRLATTTFSWPKDNGYFNFWREQPLINDSSKASKAFSSSFFSRGLFSILQNNNRER